MLDVDVQVQHVDAGHFVSGRNVTRLITTSTAESRLVFI